MTFKNIFILLCVLINTQLFAQGVQLEITLLDKQSEKPIDFAHFQYGEQNGLSDENGLIKFYFENEQDLSFSHINYGVWTLNNEEVIQAIGTKSIYRNQITQNVFPVTVIGLKPHAQQPEEELIIKYQDKLEHDGVEILNQLPSFNSIRKGGNYGFDPVFRGFKYDQLNIVYDGAQSATAACPNRMDPPTSQMSPNMMDKIEVLKGPYALRYGMGFGATINFIPAKLRFTDEAKPYGRISTGYESNGNITKGESQVGYSGAKYDISLFGSWSQGNDYKAGNGDLIPADYFRGSIGANAGFKVTDKQQLRFSLMYNHAKDVDFPSLAMDLRKDQTWMMNARHDVQINKKALQSWNTSVFGSFVDHRMDNLLKEIDPRMVNASTDATTFNYGGRTEGIWIFGKSKLYTGADLKIEGAKGVRTREFVAGPNNGKTFNDDAWQNGQITKTALFTEYQLNGSSVDLVFSGRLEMNNAVVKDPSTEFLNVYNEANSNQINPSLSMGILKEFNHQIKTGLWLGRAQRSGGLTEKYINYFPVGQDPFELIGNPQLKPEVNNQMDLTFSWEPMDESKVDIDLFASYMQNYISSFIDTTLSPRLPSSPGVRQFTNIDNALKAGVELSWTQRIVKNLHHQFGLAYTFGQNLTNGQALPEIAPLDLRYTLMGSYFKNKLRPEIIFRYVANQSRIASDFGETETPSFILLDIKLSYLATKNFSVNVGVNNILDQTYYEHLSRSVASNTGSFYAPGRNFFANLNYAF